MSNDEYQSKDFWDQPIRIKPLRKPNLWIPYKEWWINKYLISRVKDEIPEDIREEVIKIVDGE